MIEQSLSGTQLSWSENRAGAWVYANYVSKSDSDSIKYAIDGLVLLTVPRRHEAHPICTAPLPQQLVSVKNSTSLT